MNLAHVCLDIELSKPIFFQGGNEGELTKEEKAMKKQMEMVAKYLRRAVKCKKATIKGQNIEFFTGMPFAWRLRVCVENLGTLCRGSETVHSLTEVLSLLSTYLPIVSHEGVLFDDRVRRRYVHAYSYGA